MCIIWKGWRMKRGRKCNLQSQRQRQRDRDFKSRFGRAQRAMGTSGKQLVWIQDRKHRGKSAWGKAPIVIPCGAYCRHRVWVTIWNDSKGEIGGLSPTCPWRSRYWFMNKSFIRDLFIFLMTRLNRFAKLNNKFMNCSWVNNSQTYWTKNRFVRELSH